MQCQAYDTSMMNAVPSPEHKKYIFYHCLSYIPMQCNARSLCGNQCDPFCCLNFKICDFPLQVFFRISRIEF